MPHLRLVGLDDAGRLLLRGDDGQEHTVSIDDQLEAAVRRGRPSTGQVEKHMEALRPREIQARVRSGESPESVASASGVDLERVERFARPVLQEREHVADVARQVVVRAGGVEAPLAELVDHRLAHLDGSAEREWDAWRRDDGRWTVQLSFGDGSGPRTARWSFDPHTRSVAVDDDTARAITDGGTVTAPEAPPAEAAAPASGPQRRLLSVPDLDDSGADDEGADGYDEDEIADELAALGLQPVEARPAAGSGADQNATLTLDLDADAPVDEPPAAPPAEAEEAPAKKKPAKKAAKKRASKRASVPSWDDIVFGSRKPE